MGIQFKPLRKLAEFIGKGTTKTTDKPSPSPPGNAGHGSGLSRRTSSADSMPPRAAMPPQLPELHPLPALPDFSNWQLGDAAKLDRPHAAPAGAPAAAAQEGAPAQPTRPRASRPLAGTNPLHRADVAGPGTAVRPASAQAAGPDQPASPGPQGSTLRRRNALGRSSSAPQRIRPDVHAMPGAGEPKPPARLQQRRSEPQMSSNAIAQSRILSGSTSIADVLSSSSPVDVGMMKQVFAPQFQTREGWQATFDQQLHGSVSDTLRDTTDWNTGTFHALFMAAWATKPTEKGAYMIDLSGLDGAQLQAIAKAHEEHCYARASSHLSGQGRSASEGWDFLNGYKELLVQMETVDGKPYLYLKNEGHTTKAADFVPHTMGYLHKLKTGEGLMASPYLHALSNASPHLVEGRAAENYGKQYGKLLKELGLSAKSRTVTTQEMAQTLFAATRFKVGDGPTAKAFVDSATNEQLGRALLDYCNQAQAHGAPRHLRRVGNSQVTDGMLVELSKVAQSLVADGATRHGRIHREVILSPQQLDQTLAKFQ